MFFVEAIGDDIIHRGFICRDLEAVKSSIDEIFIVIQPYFPTLTLKISKLNKKVCAAGSVAEIKDIIQPFGRKIYVSFNIVEVDFMQPIELMS